MELDEQRSRRRAALITAAIDVIAERGLAGTRLADVGSRAGISTGHVLYYFENKADLFLQALRWVEHELQDAARSAFTGISSAADRWAWLLETAAPVGSGDVRLLLWLEAWERAPRDRLVAQVLAELEAQWMGLLTGVLRYGERTGELVVADLEDFALRFSALMDGLTIQVVTGCGHVDRDAMLAICRAVSDSELQWRSPRSTRAEEHH